MELFLRAMQQIGSPGLTGILAEDFLLTTLNIKVSYCPEFGLHS
jgi:hypothetical protein